MIRIHQSSSLKGEIPVPGDKSVSHRSIMLGAIAEGETHIRHFLNAADCRSTISCFRQMGIEINAKDDEVTVTGKGLYGLTKPGRILDAGNSGTTIRLISGILSGQSFSSCITGDASVCRRPMKRIMDPLGQMGADIRSVNNDSCAPLDIRPSLLHGIHWQTPVASAQVKSCILLAGLYANSPVTVIEPSLSRDHTERMMKYFGADVTSEEQIMADQVSGRIGKAGIITMQPGRILHGCKIDVPGDISSAAFFIAAALIVPGSEILLKNVGINPTRDGILRICEEMGGKIEKLNEKTSGGEKSCDLLIRSSSLHAVRISGDIIPSLIDELPVLAVLAAFAEGTTVICDAAELKVKESDRIRSVTENLIKMGADIIPTSDGMIINGGKALHGAWINCYHDHRISMSFAVAALAADGETILDDEQCVRISYPKFFEDLQSLAAD